MKKKLFLLGFILSAFVGYTQESFMVKTETRYWDNTNAYNGYTLFGTRGTTYLVDMEGHIIHTWAIGTNPRFTEAGTLLDAYHFDATSSIYFGDQVYNIIKDF